MEIGYWIIGNQQCLLWLPETIALNIYFKILFLYLFWAVLGLHCCMGFPLVKVSRGYSLVVVCGLLTVVASYCGMQALEYNL